MASLEMMKTPYWEKADLKETEKVTSFKELSLVAARILRRMKNIHPGDEIVMICGPMWSGSLGIQENHRRFELVTKYFANSGLCLFRQMPFQKAMERIQKNGNYDYPNEKLLIDFYGEIFQMGIIKKLIFLPNYLESFGASWEFEQAEKYSISKEVLPQNFFENL